MNTTNYAFPFDPTGTQASNRIRGERQTISSPGWSDFYFTIPKAAPFFRDSLEVYHHPSGRRLYEGVDYLPSHRFHDASLAVGKPIYGSITYFDKTLTGVVELHYNTIGGEWTIDEQTILQILSDTLTNPRITTWEQVVNVPREFPVIDHEWDLVDMVGASEVVEKLGEIRQAIIDSGEGGLGEHLADYNNPHEVTKSQVGLGEVENYRVANLAEAQEGTSNVRYMTPLRTAQAILEQAGEPLRLHRENYSNPHQVNKEQVGLGLVQNYALSSQSEAETGSSNTRYMTPLRTAQAIAARAVAPLNTHIGDRGNPHQVTKAQVGLGDVENFGVASLQDARAGTATDLYMTPVLVREAIVAIVGSDINNHVNNSNNPHQVTKAQVGLSQVENFAVSSQDAAEEGEANNLYMTPLRVKQAVAAQIGDNLDNHINDTGNPHNVTKAQVGLGNVDNYPTASVAMMEVGTSENAFATPAGVRRAIEVFGGGDAGAHAARTDNPHNVTKSQVGLGNVENYSVASEAEAQAGQDNSRYMTPLRVNDAIKELALKPLTTHSDRNDNPHGVTKAQVGLGEVPNWAPASELEAQEGVATNRFMSPAMTRRTIEALSGEAVSGHADRRDNPHGVSKEQVGLGNVQNFAVADESTAKAAMSEGHYMTPLGVRQAVEELAIQDLTQHVANDENPHNVTKEQIGLGNVPNYGPADSDSAAAGTATDQIMTPALVRHAILEMTGGSVDEHAGRQDNPHAVTKVQVGLGNVENFPIATDADMQVGSAEAYTTPTLVRDYVAQTMQPLDAHLENESNPHNVTAAQIGAYTMAEVDSQLENYLGIHATAANANTLEGLSLDEVVARASSDGRSRRFDAVRPTETEVDGETVIVNDGPTWTLLAQLNPELGTAAPNVMLISGGEPDGSGSTATLLVQVDFSKPEEIEARLIAGNEPTIGLAWRQDEGGAVQLWSVNPAHRNLIEITTIRTINGIVLQTDFNSDQAPPDLNPIAIQKVAGEAVDSGGTELLTVNVFHSHDEMVAGYLTRTPMWEEYRDFEPLVIAADGTVTEQYDSWSGDQETPEGGVLNAGIVRHTSDDYSLKVLSGPSAKVDGRTTVRVRARAFGNEGAVGVCLGLVERNGRRQGVYVLRTDGSLVTKALAGEVPGGENYGLLTVGYNLLQDDAIVAAAVSDGLAWGDGVMHENRDTVGAYDPVAAAVAAGGDLYASLGWVDIEVTTTENAIHVITDGFGDSSQSASVSLQKADHPELAALVDAPGHWALAHAGPLTVEYSIDECPHLQRPYVLWDPAAGDGSPVSEVAVDPGGGWRSLSPEQGRKMIAGRMLYSENSGRLYMGRRDGTVRRIFIEADTMTPQTVLTT